MPLPSIGQLVKHPEGGAPQIASRKTRPSLLTRNKGEAALTRAGIPSSRPELSLTAQAWVSRTSGMRLAIMVVPCPI